MSTLKVNTIQTTSGGSSSTPEQIQQGRAKAWVNFAGDSSGTNKTIRDDFNVSTVADNGTGDYTVNFSTAMANNNYSVACTTQGANGSSQAVLSVETDHSTAFATNSIRVQLVKTSSSGGVDRNVCCVIVFGD